MTGIRTRRNKFAPNPGHFPFDSDALSRRRQCSLNGNQTITSSANFSDDSKAIQVSCFAQELALDGEQSAGNQLDGQHISLDAISSPSCSR